MFTKVTATLLIPIFLSIGFSRYIVLAGFEVNKDFIISSLCVNKGKPQLHCKGKCFLSIKIKEAEQKEKGAAQEYKKNASLVALIGETPEMYLPPALIRVQWYREHNYLYPQKTYSIFQPPKFSV